MVIWHKENGDNFSHSTNMLKINLCKNKLYKIPEKYIPKIICNDYSNKIIWDLNLSSWEEKKQKKKSNNCWSQYTQK